MKKRNALPSEEQHVRDSVKWCRKHNLDFSGIMYSDELVSSDGVHIQLFVDEFHLPSQIREAVEEAYRERDIVKMEIIIVPTAWLGW